MEFWPLSAKYKYHRWLIGVSVLWLIVFGFLTQMAHQGIIYPDSHSYWVSADNLYVHLRGHNFRPVLMAVISGIPYLFGGGQPEIYEFSFYVNAISWIGSVLATFAILKMFLTQRKAFYWALLTLFLVGNLALVFHLLTETVYLFMVMVSFWLLLVYDKTKHFKYLATALALLLLTMLIRPGGMVFALAVSVWYARPVLRNLRSRWHVFTGGALLLIFVQCAGMKYQFGNFTLSYIDTVTYYNYLGSKAVAFKEGRVFNEMEDPRTDAIYPLDGPKQKMYAAADFRHQLLHNTNHLFLAYADNLLENALTGSIAIRDCKNVSNAEIFAAPMLFALSKWQNRILSVAGILLGLVYLFGRNESSPYRAMAFFVLCTVFLTGISCSQGDRFHVVTFPVVLILLAKSLCAYQSRSKRFFAPLQRGWRFLP